MNQIFTPSETENKTDFKLFIAGSFTVSLVIQVRGMEDFGKVPWHFYDK